MTPYNGKSKKTYKQALEWMVLNDDTEWVKNGDPISVTAAFLADMYDVSDEKLREDLLREMKREFRNKTPLSPMDRFYSLQKEGEDYYPVKLVQSYSLDALPTYEQFKGDLTEKEEADE